MTLKIKTAYLSIFRSVFQKILWQPYVELHRLSLKWWSGTDLTQTVKNEWATFTRGISFTGPLLIEIIRVSSSQWTIGLQEVNIYQNLVRSLLAESSIAEALETKNHLKPNRLHEKIFFKKLVPQRIMVKTIKKSRFILSAIFSQTIYWIDMALTLSRFSASFI